MMPFQKTLFPVAGAIGILLLAGCEKGDDGPTDGPSAAPSTDSSLSIYGPSERTFPNAVTMLYKPRSVWYLSLNATDRRTYRTAATLAFHPDFVPTVGTFAIEPLGDLERPDVYAVIEHSPVLGDPDATTNYSENSSGTVTFTSVDPIVEGTFKFEATTDDGESAMVTGVFKTDRPKGLGP